MLETMQKRALESLLAEDDPGTQALVVAQLCANPADKYRSVMREFAASPDARVRNSALKILSSWGCDESRLALFLREIRSNPWRTWSDLERFNWALCEFEDARFSRTAGLEYLYQLAARVERLAAGAVGDAERVAALRRVLGEEDGFRGDVNNYYRPANSHLGAVLQSRRGLPLTVTLVYIFVGRRLGWQVGGVGVPSHYLGVLGKVLFDPFYGGMILDEAEALAHFKIQDPGCGCLFSFKTTPYETAKRICANLLKAYALAEDRERCQRINRVLEELLALNDRH
jgi:hypothetical protein